MYAVADAQREDETVAKSKKQRDRERRKAERLAREAEIWERAGRRTAAKYASGKILKGK